MNYSNVTNCKYVTEDGLHIGCQVTFENLGQVYFVASSKDSEAHGREIYQRAKNGEFGSIDSYVPIKSELTLDQRQEQERNNRNVLLAQLDSLISNPLRWAALTDQEKGDISNYRSELLNVPQQPGFPDNISWPNTPTFVSANTKNVTLTIIR